ncbi:MAG TPA: DUF3391 domain-containing protein [Arenimonas sp.]|nr:DUF3391 domain-containing protein [Arenimonas sp.]
MADDDSLIDPEQLCVGLYVELDLPWMDHPFAFSKFKIKSADQIETLKRLGLDQIRYNRAKSDRAPLPLNPEAPVTPKAKPEPTPEEKAAAAEKKARIERMEQISESIAQVEQKFAQAARTLKQINQVMRSKPEEAFEHADGLVTELVAASMAAGDTQLHAISQSMGEDTYFHSLNVAILSMILGNAIHLKEAELQQLGLGAILHDIGQCEVPDLVLARRESLNKSEQAVYESHVKSGLKIAGKLAVSPDALAVIAQHHERADGSGYPERLTNEKMNPLARIVALVNAYDNLCNPQNMTLALTPYEALAFMFGKQRSKFDETLLRTMIKCLGVYPPGTLVRLSDQRIALVLSVNAKQALQPTVMLYDPEVPKEAALMLDLEQEPGTKIIEGLRPTAIPAEVFNYLNPRQRVTFYFDKQPGQKSN